MGCRILGHIYKVSYLGAFIRPPFPLFLSLRSTFVNL